jgi:hypothetical protein
MTAIENVETIGDQAQVVFGNTVSHDLIVQQITYVRRQPSMDLSEDQIAERVAGYVPAANHHQIVESLRRDQVVALAGRPATGVRTTAIAALQNVHPGLPIRHLSTDKDDIDQIRQAIPHGYLAQAADEEKMPLWTCSDAVRASGSFLVVVGEPQEFERFAEFLTPTHVQPPPADAVYRHRLQQRGFGTTSWVDWPRAGELLKGGLPGHGRRLADLVLAAVAENRDTAEVEQAYLGWREQLRAWFTKYSDPRDRALMVAAATITPADETSVYGAALSLARQLDVPVAGGGLAWRPTTGLASLLNADHDGGSRIVFRRHGFADSVLQHVWDEYPLVRTDLLEWLSRLPMQGTTLEVALRNRLAEAFARLAAEHEAVDMIRVTVETWSESGQWGADLAYIVLARTCLHPLVGGRVRTALYQWSRERSAPQNLKLTVARACQVLGETHASIALTRLKHLATYGNEQVRDEVVDVCRELAAAHPGVMFDAAVSWCESAADMSGRDAARRADAGLRLLLSFVRDDQDAPRLQTVLQTAENLAARGGAEIRPVLLDAMLALAEHYRARVLEAAVGWVGDGGGPFGDGTEKARIGTQLFLELAARPDAAGNAAVLTGAEPVDPVSCSAAWSVALNAEPPSDLSAATMVRIRPSDTGYEGFEDAAGRWLDTAESRKDLRPGIVAAASAARERVAARESPAGAVTPTVVFGL